MSRKLSAGQGRGQRKSCNSHSAELLACCLGISNLRYLTDEEVETLIDIAKIAVDQVYADGYSRGWNEAMNYNTDVAQLVHAAPSTEH